MTRSAFGLRPSTFFLSLALALGGEAVAADPAPIRAGMIGLDTSHVAAFVKLFNDPKAANDIAGIKIVAAYPGGTDMPASRTRIAKFTETVRDAGVEVVDSIPRLLEKIDVVFLESVDGRIHLQEATPVIRAGKPLFIDKPAAGTLADAVAIYELAKKYDVPCFSSSALRFTAGVEDLGKKPELGKITGALSWGPCDYEPNTPDLFFYGIHGVEPLFAIMGRGCESVTRLQTQEVDMVSGVWSDGRVASYRGFRGSKGGFGLVAFGTLAFAPAPPGSLSGYRGLCGEIARFFKTRKVPVSAEETLEVLAFMEAADESKRQGGKPVTLASVLAKARAEAATKIP
jgi:predicted dehydrogenase